MGRWIVALIAVFVLAAPARAQVTTVRTGDENPMKSVAKSTLWGGITGLMLGGTLALVTDGHDADVLKWSFVGGVWGGFGMGLYHVSRRPAPSLGAIRFDADGPRLGLPHAAWAMSANDRHASLTLVSWSF